jgi:tRNA(Arg) A34 adenosine deaminase TadA
VCRVPDDTGPNAPLPELAELLPADVDLSGTLGVVLRGTVPSAAPQTRAQYREAAKLWPISFHENKPLQRAMDATAILASEGGYLRRCMEAACQAALGAQDANGGGGAGAASFPFIAHAAALGNPRTGQVVAVALDERGRHPLRHATMILIEETARRQAAQETAIGHRGRAIHDGSGRENGGACDDADAGATGRGATGRAAGDGGAVTDGGKRKPLKSDVPHLCSNLDLFATHEPCAM